MHSEFANLVDAMQVCSDSGGQLPSVHSEKDNAVLRQFAAAHGVDVEIWLAAQDILVEVRN